MCIPLLWLVGMYQCVLGVSLFSFGTANSRNVRLFKLLWVYTARENGNQFNTNTDVKHSLLTEQSLSHIV